MSFDLNMNNSGVPSERDLGSYSFFDLRNPRCGKGKNNEVELRRSRRPFEKTRLLVRTPNKPKQFSAGQIALECNAALLRGEL